MQSALKCSYVLISAYNLLAFPAYPPLLTISTPIIHSWLIILLISAFMLLFLDPAFINTFIKWKKGHKVFPNPALRFGTKRVQAI